MTVTTSNTYAHQWSEANPKPTNISARIQNIPAYVNAGDNLMVEVDEVVHPCRVVDIRNVNNPELLVNIWVFESTISECEGLAPLDIIRYNNVHEMRGVMHSNWLRTVSISAVRNFAYIFHCDTIQMGQYANAHGMNFFFNTRYKQYTTEQSIIRLVF